MILTVTANPAVDVTYTVPELHPGAVHRVTEVTQRAGGKGLNVARVLRSLGEEVIATGFTGGPAGQWLTEQGTAAGISMHFVEALPDVRRTTVVRAGDQTTSLWEPGQRPPDPAAAEQALLERVDTLLAGAERPDQPAVRALAVCGSLPAGISPDLPVRLAQRATRAGVPVVLDLDGAPLQAAARAGLPVVLTPNQDEVEALTGARPGSAAEAVSAIAPLLDRGLAAVIVTLGEAGMVAVWAGGSHAAAPPEPVAGNPTGAGDAAVAATLRHLARARGTTASGEDDGAAGDGIPPRWSGEIDWPTLVEDATVTAAASVLRPVAGEIDLAARRRWLTRPTPDQES